MPSNESNKNQARLLEQWCSDQLHGLLGFSDSHLAKYLIHVATKATHVKEIEDTLQQGNVVVASSTTSASSDPQAAFCQALYAKCQPPKISRSSQAPVGTRTGTKAGMKTNADWVQKAGEYSLLEEEDEDEKKTRKGKSTSKRSGQQPSPSPAVSEEPNKTNNSSRESKKERLQERKRRRRHQDGKDEESSSSSNNDNPNSRGVRRESVQDRRERRRRERLDGNEEGVDNTEDALTEEQRTEIDRERDLRERDEFVQRMLEKDRHKTKQQTKSDKGFDDDDEINETREAMERRLDLEQRLARGETVMGDDGKAMTLERLRVESRRAYLKKRQEREVTLLKQSLQDEDELFRNQKLTAAERKRIELGRKIIKMVETNENPEDKNDGFYRLPDEYNEGDTKGSQDQALLSSRYVEPVKEKSEQELWEEAQTMKAAKVVPVWKKAKDEKQYDLVFDEQIDFVMQETTKGYDKRDKTRRPIPDEPTSDALAKKESQPLMTEHEKILLGRKKLPVYPYREEFLAAVKEHQILVLVGETGSGKVRHPAELLILVSYWWYVVKS